MRDGAGDVLLKLGGVGSESAPTSQAGIPPSPVAMQPAGGGAVQPSPMPLPPLGVPRRGRDDPASRRGGGSGLGYRYEARALDLAAVGRERDAVAVPGRLREWAQSQ